MSVTAYSSRRSSELLALNELKVLGIPGPLILSGFFEGVEPGGLNLGGGRSWWNLLRRVFKTYVFSQPPPGHLGIYWAGAVLLKLVHILPLAEDHTCGLRNRE